QRPETWERGPWRTEHLKRATRSTQKGWFRRCRRVARPSRPVATSDILVTPCDLESGFAAARCSTDQPTAARDATVGDGDMERRTDNDTVWMLPTTTGA